MTINEFCSKIHLPSVVTHFSWDMPKIYKKLPMFGWYGLSKNEDMTFNCIDLYRYNVASATKLDDLRLMHECYKYYTLEHPELFEAPVRYSETIENKLASNYLFKATNDRFYRACRAEALEGTANYNAKPWKFAKLLEHLGMPTFMNSGIGLITSRVLRAREFSILCLEDKIDKDIILIPSFFAPNNKLASLEAAVLGDLSVRKMIYLDRECGWYGRLGTNIVGGIRDLLTTDGCTWNPKITNWVGDKVLNLHHSLQPNQCIEIWTSKDNLTTDKNPISLIQKNNLADHIKDNIRNLTVDQITQLEKLTGQELHQSWLTLKTSEATVSGQKFISNNGKYYYLRGNIPIEYTNFIIELVKIKKEDGEFYQYGQVIMNSDSSPFRIKREHFVSQNSLLKSLTNVTLEAGLGIPVVAPNLKHYITNVIEAFNPVNQMDKPKPAMESSAVSEQNVMVLGEL